MYLNTWIKLVFVYLLTGFKKQYIGPFSVRVSEDISKYTCTKNPM